MILNSYLYYTCALLKNYHINILIIHDAVPLNYVINKNADPTNISEF